MKKGWNYALIIFLAIIFLYAIVWVVTALFTRHYNYEDIIIILFLIISSRFLPPLIQKLFKGKK